MKTFLAPLLDGSAGAWLLRNHRTTKALATRVETAFDSPSRRRGLLGRTRLGPDTALILAPCSAVHTCFMQFPIDVVFVQRNGEVAKVVRNLRPWRIAAAFGAFAAIELASGAADASGTTRDDLLHVEPLASLPDKTACSAFWLQLDVRLVLTRHAARPVRKLTGIRGVRRLQFSWLTGMPGRRRDSRYRLSRPFDGAFLSFQEVDIERRDEREVFALSDTPVRSGQRLRLDVLGPGPRSSVHVLLVETTPIIEGGSLKYRLRLEIVD